MVLFATFFAYFIKCRALSWEVNVFCEEFFACPLFDFGVCLFTENILDL